MKPLISRLSLLLSVVVLLAAGCSKDSSPTTPPTDNGTDTEAPTISLISPKMNESVGRTSLIVEAQVSDNKAVTKVEVYLDNIKNPVANLSASPWKTIIAIAGLQDGDHTVYAKAYDAAGNIGTSIVITFTRGELVDISEPAVSVITPRVNELVGDEMAVSINASDNVGVIKVELFLDGATTPTSTLLSLPWETILPISTLNDGNHTISAKAYDAANNVGTAPVVTFRKGLVRMSLVEIVTSANCPPCGPANEYFRTNTSSASFQSHMISIKNHVWWPRNTDRLWTESQTWSNPRTEYLFNPITQFVAPNAWVGGQNMGSTAADWVAQVTQDMKLPAEAKIVLEKTDNGNQVTITARITGMTGSNYSDLRLHTVVTESNINYNDGNSEYVHYDVMRHMYPDAEGEAITLPQGQEKTFTRTIDIDSKWTKSNLKVVVFVQSYGTKKILQAGRLSLK